MRPKLAFLLVLAACVVSPFPADVGYALVQDGTALEETCSRTYPAIDQAGLAAVVGDVPEGVDALVIARHPLPDVLPSSGYVVQIERMVVEAETDSMAREIPTSTVFLVVDGTIGVSENGRLRGGRPLAQGESLLVPSGKRVSLLNDANEPVTVLLLSLQPPSTQVPENRRSYLLPPAEDIDVIFPEDVDTDPPDLGIEPTDVDPSPFPYEIGFNIELIAAAQIERSSEAALTLALVCLRWADSAPDRLEIQAATAVGILVLRGAVLVDGEELTAGGTCWLDPDDDPVELQAGDTPPHVLLFGALSLDTPSTEGADASAPAPSAASSSECSDAGAGDGPEG